ncbi:efflux RND transporter permease subunit [soil metagenome]
MLNAIVAWSLDRARIILAFAALLLIYGGMTLSHASYDVFPEFVPAQAEVQTESPGLTAEQVEQLVTRPIEQAVAGAAGVETVRSDSTQGLSKVTVTFKSGADPYRSRQIVAEALGEAASGLPAGVGPPKVAPLTSSTMDLLKVGFTSDKLTPAELRDLVQWTVRPRLLSAPGVARATIYGGEIRRIEIRVRPADLALHDLSFDAVIAAARTATGVTGGGFIDTPEQRILIATQGQATTPAEVGAAQITTVDGVPVLLSDVADVVEGMTPLDGDALIMGRPGVLLALSSQYGANTLTATKGLEAALTELKPTLDAAGVTVNAGLHRPANFIEAALGGIVEDLLIGAALIAFVLFVFMRNIRAVLISFVSIPLSLLVAVIVLDRMGWTINTMTLGGLAVALGVVVDDAVIDVENIVRRLRIRDETEPTAVTILHASLEVRAPVIYATLVVALILSPVLFLHGIEGSFFSPLAAAFILATLASLAVAVVVTPALSLLLLARARLPEEPGPLVRLKTKHSGLLQRISARPRGALIVSIVAMIVSGAGFALFNTELLPAFREGHFVLAVAARPGASLAVMRTYGKAITRDLLAVPGIQSVEQEIGRAQGGEDTWGTETSEFHVELKPKLSGGEQDRIETRIQDILGSYPGLQTEVLTFLGDRIGESFSGQTASVVVSLYGADADTLDRMAGQADAVLKTVPGATDVKLRTPPSTPAVKITLDPVAVGRYGLSPAEVLDAVQTAYQGTTAAQVYRQDRALDIAVTTPPDLRAQPEAVGDLVIRSASGAVVPLRHVATVSLVDGRTVVSHDGGRAVSVVTANPAPKDVARVTRAAQAAIGRIKLPAGVYVEYTGSAAGAASARNDLLLNVGVALIGVVVLLLLAFRSGRAVGLILGTAPGALVGGVIAVALTGGSLSLGSLVGFVALFGIASRNAILLISHTEHLVTHEGHDWSLETVIVAARERLTPILMTALVTGLGILPLALQTGQAGREIQGPMAIVILGGLVTSTLISLLVLPALIWRYWRPLSTMPVIVPEPG